MNPISRIEIYAIIAAVLGLAIFGAYFTGHHRGYVEGEQVVQVKFDKFVNDTTAAGLKAQQDNLDKEKLYATNIANATAGRAYALGELQRLQAAASAGRRASTSNPRAAAGSKQVCIDSAAYNAAFQQFGSKLDGFIQAARGFAIEGDSAQIDAKSVIDAWPKSAVK